MQEHYGLSDEAFANLLSKGITIADMYHAVKEFKAHNAPVSMISLMHYVDTHGDFTEGDSKTDVIAQAVLDQLPIRQKIAVGEYIEIMSEEIEIIDMDD